MKQKCAKAAYEMIKDGMVIGLGGGRTIAFLIEELKNGNKKVKAVTPSEDTMNLCVKAGIEVLPLEFVKQIDIAFDGCNEIDKNLNALKTDGGIFTREKIVAVMAKDYVILADEEKYSDELTFEHAVAMVVIIGATGFIGMYTTEAFLKKGEDVVATGRNKLLGKKLEEMGAKVEERSTEMKMGTLVSDDGNYLMNAYFEKGQDVKALDEKLKHITGIVETSLFYNIVSKALIAGESGIRVID